MGELTLPSFPSPPQLPVSPRLGKMLLWAVLFRCLDPVLTVACALSYRPPFAMPMHSGEKRAADQARLALARGWRSDHLALLGAYAGFHEARRRGGGAPGSAAEFAFCRDNFLSPPALNMVTALREQMVSELVESGALAAVEGAGGGSGGGSGGRRGGGRGGASSGRGSDLLTAASVNARSMSLVSCVLAAGLYPQARLCSATSCFV